MGVQSHAHGKAEIRFDTLNPLNPACMALRHDIKQCSGTLEHFSMGAQA